MKAPNITKGPWATNKKGEVGPVSQYDDQSFGMVIPLVEVVHGEFSDVKAIAAVPDLIEALIEYVNADLVDIELNSRKQQAICALLKAGCTDD